MRYAGFYVISAILILLTLTVVTACSSATPVTTTETKTVIGSPTTLTATVTMTVPPVTVTQTANPPVTTSTTLTSTTSQPPLTTIKGGTAPTPGPGQPLAITITSVGPQPAQPLTATPVPFNSSEYPYKAKLPVELESWVELWYGYSVQGGSANVRAVVKNISDRQLGIQIINHDVALKDANGKTLAAPPRTQLAVYYPPMVMPGTAVRFDVSPASPMPGSGEIATAELVVFQMIVVVR